MSTRQFREYPKSKAMYEDAQTVFAMGVGSQVQSFARPHPLYMTHGRGSKLYDVDGNEFIDYLLNGINSCFFRGNNLCF